MTCERRSGSYSASTGNGGVGDIALASATVKCPVCGNKGSPQNELPFKPTELATIRECQGCGADLIPGTLPWSRPVVVDEDTWRYMLERMSAEPADWRDQFHEARAERRERFGQREREAPQQGGLHGGAVGTTPLRRAGLESGLGSREARGRRRDLFAWPWEQVMRQTVYCVASDPWDLDARAAIVLHLDPELLPTGWLAAAAERAQGRGQDVPGGTPEYVVLGFAYEAGTDRSRLLMDGERSHLIYENAQTTSRKAASELAENWVGGKADERPFRELPGIYQAAFHDWITQRRGAIDHTTFTWIFPAPKPDYFTLREFPPPAKPSEITPDPDEVTCILVPAAAVEDWYRQRGW
jgi:hypothetical protein